MKNVCNLSESAIKVLEKRYLVKDENGNAIEDVEGMFRRVARAVARADEEYGASESELQNIEDEFFELMSSLSFLPNSPTLMNAGRPLGQLSACFVLPIEDTMEDIFETVKSAALIHKSGGGTGFSFSRLRPKGASVNSTGGVASGPVSFMKVFNAATEAVKQGGTRRGANMGILRIDHPDILEFISCKKDSFEINNFNISVGITEKFMEAVEIGDDYDLVDPHTNSVVRTLNAKQVFNLIVDMAWRNGEPGIVFIDRLNKDNITPEIGVIESTNPCGEQPLLPYEACNLGSINLNIMTKNQGGIVKIDYKKLKSVVQKAVYFLDNVIDVNKYPLPQIDEMTRGTRKIGLGVMGWADLLCKLGIRYNSEKALTLAEEVMEFINKSAREASIEIANRKGVFPYYDKSIFKEKEIKIRNATTTTIAPTGTLSMIAGVSGGIEPLFAINYIRNIMDNSEFLETNPQFKEIAIKEEFYSEELMMSIAKKGSAKGFPQVPQKIQDLFITSHEVSPEWHVRMQAAFQKFTDNAVSKTVNLSHNATRDDVAEAFILAYKTDCKGITIYRDGSRAFQVLNIGEVKGEDLVKEIQEATENSKSHNRVIPRPRPDITTGITEKVKIGCGNLYITANYDEFGICEVFTNTGRAGGCPSQSEATSRLVSIAMRAGIDAKSIVEQLKGIRCPSTIRQPNLKVMSCPDAIGRLIEKVMKIQSANGNGAPTYHKELCIEEEEQLVAARRGKGEEKLLFRTVTDVCPECGKEVEHEGGCVVCRNCGFSKCG